ncbi:TonB-dependent receptor plug domain-containing protein [Candidatus Poribacteria bacterium]|nr:TonB-dependent receptor plug domain-containing protein [Candidatus Poribacteria bacterium]
MLKKYNAISLLLICLFFILVLFLITFNHAIASENGSISGTVYQKGSGDPLADVRIYLLGNNTNTLTDTSGQYKFSNLAAGKYKILVSIEGYKSIREELQVQDGKSVETDFYLEKEILDAGNVTVTGKRSVAVPPSKVEVTNTEITRIPGTGGDVLKAIQTLPGISTMGDFSGQLFIRGGSPEDNSFYFDDIFLPYPYHFGGFTSTLNPEIIKQVDVYAGGFDAEYGDSQAVVDISSYNRKKDSLSSTLNINMLMAEGLMEGSFGDKDSWYIAGRRSYIDLFPIKSDNIIALPQFWDYQTRFNYTINDNNSISISSFGADDFMKLYLKEEDVTDDPELAGTFHWRNAYHSQGITWHTESLRRLSSSLTLSHNYLLWDMKMGKGLFLRADPHLYTLRNDNTIPLGDKYSLQAGVGAGWMNFKIKAHFIRPPGEDNPDVSTFTESEKVFSDTEENYAFGNTYIQINYRLFEPLVLSIGGRGDYNGEIEEFTLSPRLSLSFALDDMSNFKLAYGKYSQSPDESQVSEDWGNPDLTNSMAYHYVAEFERKLPNNLLAKVAFYRKDLENLVTSDPEEIYLNQGKGYAQGLELFIKQKEIGPFFGWLSYSYSISKRKDRPEEPWRLYSYDQTHVLTAVANYKITPSMELGGKWRYSTGTPYTPVIGATEVYNPITGTIGWNPIYGADNSERLSPYHRLDLRLSKYFSIKGVQMSAYLEIMNVYNRKNVMALDYNDDYTEEEKVYMLPVIPYFGITARF